MVMMKIRFYYFNVIRFGHRFHSTNTFDTGWFRTFWCICKKFHSAAKFILHWKKFLHFASQKTVEVSGITLYVILTVNVAVLAHGPRKRLQTETSRRHRMILTGQALTISKRCAFYLFIIWVCIYKISQSPVEWTVMHCVVVCEYVRVRSQTFLLPIAIKLSATENIYRNFQTYFTSQWCRFHTSCCSSRRSPKSFRILSADPTLEGMLQAKMVPLM